MAQPATGGSSVNRDLGYKVRSLPTIPANVVNNTSDGTGLGVDLKGYEGASMGIYVGISGDTLSGSVYHLVSVQDSADGSTGWADVDAAQMRITSYLDFSGGAPTITENTAFAVIDAAAEDDIYYEVTLLPGTGLARYVRALVTVTGTHTVGTPIAAWVNRGFPRVEIAAKS